MVTTPGVWILRTRAQDPCRPGVGLRPAADHPQMVTTPGVLDPADPRARSLQLLLDISDKVDEKVDNSGWRIKIVADVGIPTKLSDISGCPVEPFFPAAESGP